MGHTIIDHYSDTEWLIQTEKHISGYYENKGRSIVNLKKMIKPDNEGEK